MLSLSGTAELQTAAVSVFRERILEGREKWSRKGKKKRVPAWHTGFLPLRLETESIDSLLLYARQEMAIDSEGLSVCLIQLAR